MEENVIRKQAGAIYAAQTVASEYQAHSYRKQERWDSFWHQIDFVRRESPKSVLEIGPGPGIVTRALCDAGIAVTTLDVAEDVHPDVVGSITSLPLPDRSFDVVLAAEVLEHISAEDVSSAFKELSRVARDRVVISVPTPGMSVLLIGKFPCTPRFQVFIKIPFFWREHAFDGQHYWELSTRGRSMRWFTACAKVAGLKLVRTVIYPDAPYHRFFVFKKEIR